ncbi:hypothetical protein ACJX0J_018393 [Zea mays]
MNHNHSNKGWSASLGSGRSTLLHDRLQRFVTCMVLIWPIYPASFLHIVSRATCSPKTTEHLNHVKHEALHDVEFTTLINLGVPTSFFQYIIDVVTSFLHAQINHVLEQYYVYVISFILVPSFIYGEHVLFGFREKRSGLNVDDKSIMKKEPIPTRSDMYGLCVCIIRLFNSKFIIPHLFYNNTYLMFVICLTKRTNFMPQKTHTKSSSRLF